MEEAISLVLSSLGLVLFVGCILVVTVDVKTLRNKIVYKLLNVWYNIYVLK